MKLKHPVSTTEGLGELAETALTMARAKLTGPEGAVDPVILIAHDSGEVEMLPFPSKYGNIMNHGEAKDILFDWLRAYVEEHGFPAVAFGTEAWMGVQTELGKALPKEQFLRLTSEKGFETARRLGIVERKEVLVATAQNAESVVLMNQVFERRTGRVWFDEPTSSTGPQAHFAGRQKMYGDLRAENLW